MLTLTVGPMSHGGHCVARHEGRVVFVRHAIPGETVRAVVTSGDSSSRFWRADAVEIVEASDHRRHHPWKQADALRSYAQGQAPVGGADYGHITDAHQRRLKAHVFRDTMQRIGGIDVSALGISGLGPEGEPTVEHIPGSDTSGMHWRTRVTFGVSDGTLAMQPNRSHELIPLRSMPLAVEAVRDSAIFAWDFSGAQSVEVVAPGGEAPLTLIVRAAQTADQADLDRLGKRLIQFAHGSPQVSSVILATISEAGGQRPARQGRKQSRQRGRRHNQLQPAKVNFEVLVGERMVKEPLPTPVNDQDSVVIPPEGFWQIHRCAPSALVRTVDAMADLQPGGSAIDLYAGAGLFTAWAASRVGDSGQILSVEAAGGTSDAAQRLFENMPEVEVVNTPAERVAAQLSGCDVVVLDPPRAGAAARVLKGIDAADPGRIVYVSCDPASFARDAKVLGELGWSIRDLALADLYPNTHHMESVTLFQRR